MKILINTWIQFNKIVIWLFGTSTQTEVEGHELEHYTMRELSSRKRNLLPWNNGLENTVCGQ